MRLTPAAYCRVYRRQRSSGAFTGRRRDRMDAYALLSSNAHMRRASRWRLMTKCSIASTHEWSKTRENRRDFKQDVTLEKMRESPPHALEGPAGLKCTGSTKNYQGGIGSQLSQTGVCLCADGCQNAEKRGLFPARLLSGMAVAARA